MSRIFMINPQTRISKIHAALLPLFIWVCLLPLPATAQNRYDVLITECLPDPTPVAGLPESSFIELTNHSGNNYSLLNWKISNGNNSVSIKTDYILKSDSILILCPLSSLSAFSDFGATLGISGFPALNNEEGDIILSNQTGTVIHAIHYDRRWFRNDLKSGGGWSLEMIDLSNACSGSQDWTASISPRGGSPGIKNSVNDLNPDNSLPSLIRGFAMDSLTVILQFDKAMDSLTASDISNYAFSDGIGIPVSAKTEEPLFDRCKIILQNPMSRGKIYSLQVNHIRDCGLNELSQFNTCRLGISEEAKEGDVICNEILFNPPSLGYDYLELLNRSTKIINCSGLYISGRNINGSLKDPTPVTIEDRSFFPGEYVLLTVNPAWVLSNYPSSDPVKIIQLKDLPSMPDDMGKIVLLNRQGVELDELDYDHHWHSPLIVNETGVALERIHSNWPTSMAMNWTSASADAGFGTPGYKNSENTTDSIFINADFVHVQPKVFSPDRDGYQDFCFMDYELPDAGYIGNISIYDISGRLVRNLVNNSLLGTNGSFRWDGLDDRLQLLPSGHYIIYVEVFRTDGIMKTKKLVCTLARRS